MGWWLCLGGFASSTPTSVATVDSSNTCATGASSTVTRKHGEIGLLEAKAKSFYAIPQVLAFPKADIVFVEKGEELDDLPMSTSESL
jgi:hypothetical protein